MKTQTQMTYEEIILRQNYLLASIPEDEMPEDDEIDIIDEDEDDYIYEDYDLDEDLEYYEEEDEIDEDEYEEDDELWID